jgi:hypothetical protein
MFCPKCGVDSLEAQRFCKACGTNLQLINDALRTGDSPAGPFGLDVEALARNAREFAQSFKTSWSGAAGRISGSEHHAARSEASEQRRIAHEIRKQAREEARRQNLPKPKEYMSYSWQHNLRNGLMSLFWGAGLGVLLYYLSQNAINNGLLERIEEASHGRVQGIEPLVRMFWMIALLPMLKGLAQIFYAAFFGESMATLTERFTPPRASLEEPKPFLRHDTAPVDDREPARPSYETPTTEPPSVTEHTTHFFDEGKVRESQ